MKRYYIFNRSAEKGFEEVTEAEFNAIHGSEEVRPYAGKVYRGEISIDDVPKAHRSECARIVEAREKRFGRYEDLPLTGEELKQIMEEEHGVMTRAQARSFFNKAREHRF